MSFKQPPDHRGIAQTDRRQFLSQGILAAAVAAGSARVAWADEPQLKIGSALVDTTPPKGIELAGFHRAPGNERKITGIRQPTTARALVLRLGDQQVALVSLDIAGVSADFSRKVAAGVAAKAGIPAENVRICATHTHSMPAFFYLRQWGAEPKAYEAETADKVVQAVLAAKEDLSPGECFLGKSAADGGNFNRTTGTWKTDKDFAADSTADQRWLDTQVHALRFERSGKPDVIWYHFSAHPVCYTDGEAGPDWVGITAEMIREKQGVAPAFLQGHAGDVNPGNGNPWLGDPQRTAQAVADAIGRAIAGGVRQTVNKLVATAGEFQAPLDIELLKRQMQKYRDNPEQCTGGEWVDAPFAKDWFQDMQGWDLARTTLKTPLSAMRLGDIGLIFHSSELYSYYGLAIRRASPFANTLVVGYADALIGYLPDPKAFEAGEYAATTVPRIVGLPPFKPEAASSLADECRKVLTKLAAS